ncbi:MAG: HPF/RaiA family ribosome-associated protein [Planctomycetes bacterium]|nr:HPF/RaiA family ribosome-associated protein [Planctomycetota bacterium]
MKITITHRHLTLTDEVKERIEQRVGVALGRFGDRIKQVSVKFMNGKTNGDAPEYLCVIEIELNKKLKVKAADRDVLSAMDLALEHATRSIAHSLTMESGRGLGGNH